MIEPKFTPGPWALAEDDQNGQAVVRGEHTEICTCWHHCVGSLEKEMRGNASLIAAAPELYEALEHFLNGALSLPRFAEEQARAALAKARGEA